MLRAVVTPSSALSLTLVSAITVNATNTARAHRHAGYISRLGLTADKAAKSHRYIMKEFDDVGDRLERQGGGSDFLVGGQFSAADLAFACMAVPALMVQPHEGFGGYLPPTEKLPDDFRDLVTELRAHPAGQFAMRMFRLHRGNRQIPGEPRISQEPPHAIVGGPDERGGGGRLGPGVV
jgi:glutathione S-transferase